MLHRIRKIQRPQAFFMKSRFSYKHTNDGYRNTTNPSKLYEAKGAGMPAQNQWFEIQS
jgi:hypothetical protein